MVWLRKQHATDCGAMWLSSLQWNSRFSALLRVFHHNTTCQWRREPRRNTTRKVSAGPPVELNLTQIHCQSHATCFLWWVILYSTKGQSVTKPWGALLSLLPWRQTWPTWMWCLIEVGGHWLGGCGAVVWMGNTQVAVQILQNMEEIDVWMGFMCLWENVRAPQRTNWTLAHLPDN